MSEIEDIKNKLDIVDVISQYMPLKKAGRNHKGLCPFHSEKTPSFMVSSEKQIFHCFGCGKGGDIFGFLMEKEGLSFAEALNQLAEKAGIELKTRSRDWGEKSKLFTINELTTKFFEKSLTDSKEGRNAINYLINREVSRDIIKIFRLGYAPKGWEYLYKFLQRKEYSKSDIDKAGLIVQRRKGWGDKFRNRIMFPIANVSGKITGFTGRVLDPEDLPKYLNSPETPVFNKSKILYGLSVTKEEISKTKIVILVEGQMDVLASYQSGVKNVVASSGTALTSDQINLIRRYAETLILALDADSAGSQATKRAIELASASDLEIKVAILGKYKDPDEAIKEGVDKWKEIIDKAVPVIDFYIKYAVDKHGKETIVSKKKIVSEVLPVISLLDSPVEKDQYIKKLALVVDVNAQRLYEALNKVKKGSTSVKRERKTTEDAKPTEAKDPNWLEKRVLSILLYKPNYITPDIIGEFDKVIWSNKLLERIYSNFKDCYTAKDFSFNIVAEKLDYNDKISLLELMAVIEESYADISEVDIEKELKFYVNLLNRRNVKLAMAKVSQEIALAEKTNDFQKIQELLKKFKTF